MHRGTLSMNKTIAAGLCLALTASSVLAQPAPPSPEAPKGEDTLGSSGERPWAVGVSPEKQSAALAKFREANAQLNDGLFAAAVALYREALVYWDHPAINYNLALALLNLDQPLEVYGNLQRAIQFGPAPLEKEKFDHAQKYLRLVSQQIATVEVTCAKPGAKVSLDGQELFTVPATGVGKYTGRVKIGKHTFVAEKPGYDPQVITPVLGSGETFTTEIELYTQEELTRYRRRLDKTWVPWAVVGGGVVAGLAGGLLTLSAQSSFDDFDAEVARCNDTRGGPGCQVPPNLTGMRDSGESKRTFGYVAYGVAGAAVVTGAVLLVLNRPRSYRITPEQARAERKGSQGASVSVAPMAGPGVAGALLEGRF